ncbi:MAG TPA: hypothetical protein PKO38_00820 [Bacillota bacterium]|nr:hypothetical protein [Bacillota bacterium]HOB86214.1 hypothetical protein [Bacillota bacterium]HOP68764.1 hypothetical protein [Bacillota bacterium]HPT33869.1 hypothetical protein [Bacillota bacterium]HPZ64559.1 hypothetical protein [Bacillota bacterium]
MNAEIQELVLKLLEPGVYKTTAQIVEEFRAEFPEKWRALQREGEERFAGSCGAHQMPANAVRQALFSLPEEKRRCRYRRGEYSWAAASEGAGG